MEKNGTSFPAPEIWYRHRVSYGETDAMGVLYYAEYMHIFERARSKFIREHGLSYKEVEKRGIFLPVREATCRYRAPARYEDVLWTRAGVSSWGRASLVFAYELYDESKTSVLATASTQHAFVSQDSKPCAVPAWFRELIR